MRREFEHLLLRPEEVPDHHAHPKGLGMPACAPNRGVLRGCRPGPQLQQRCSFFSVPVRSGIICCIVSATVTGEPLWRLYKRVSMISTAVSASQSESKASFVAKLRMMPAS